MESIVSAINRLGDIIEKSSGTSFWTQVLISIPAAVVGLVAAVAGAWLTVFFTGRNTTRNSARALFNEIGPLVLEIKRCKDLPSSFSHTECRAVQHRNGSAPVYASLGSTLGSLNSEAVDKVTRFYSDLLTIAPVGQGQDVEQYNKTDLDLLAKKGQEAAEILRTIYHLK